MDETREQLIKRLSESGDIIKLHKQGLISSTHINYRNMYYDLLTAISKGCKPLEAAIDISIKYNCSVMTVYRAKDFMTS
jgi:hypothetical protein